MTKKKNKTRRFIEKNILNLLALVVAIVGVAVQIHNERTEIVIVNQTAPPVAQATWHSVEIWQIGVSGTAAPQTAPPFDWVGFWSDVSWCAILGVAGLIGLYYHCKDRNWKKKYQGIIVTKSLLP